MHITPEHIDEIIVRCLAQEATKEERVALATWRQLSDENERYYTELFFIYENSGKLNQQVEVNVDAAWSKVKMQMAPSEAKVVPIYPTKPRRDWSMWSAAAVLLVVCTFGAWWFLGQDTSQKALEISSAEKPKEAVLEDGTKVALEAQSSLVQISKNRREYELQGQASFNVVHDEKNPFIIHTDEALIKDIGTVFKVSYIPKNDTVAVKVTEGIVQFYTQSDEGIRLQEGESGYYLRSSKKFYRYPSLADSLVLLKSADFDNATLEEVAQKLSTDFNKTIVIEGEALKQCRIKVSFQQESLEHMLDIITATLGIWSRERDGKIVLGGKSCQ